IDLDSGLLAVVVVKDAKGDAGSTLKRRPMLHVFSLAEGEELWRYEIADVEMMPARWTKDDEKTVFTLDNYQPPLLLDNRLYMFYEGVVSLDARTGKERVRERFKVNEEGLALTEADPVFDNRQLYVSGQGKVRAISRETGREVWEAKDLGLTPQMLLANTVLFVRTGGQFTRLKDGDTVERGSYGVSAIDANTGKTLWRYKGADRGITNIILVDESTVALADRDDLIFLDARTGERKKKVGHKIERAAFVLVNAGGETVVGGTEEIAAFNFDSNREAWRVRHTPPSRGIFRIIAAVALRAASFYFRYGSLALTGFRGLQVARAASTLRWSGLARTTGRSLTSLAAASARERVSSRFTPFGVAARGGQLSRARSIPDMSIDVEERLLDRIDPASQMDKLSRLLLRRRRFATLRGEWMYFYTDLKSKDGRGLAGVNVNNGRTDREIRLSDLDDRFIADEAMGLLFIARGDRLLAYR
ncbi:MAG TPA: PQQ-binding-like beta-propeller repeat protein, partial [Blastocatellia bacterium]|nr:PQQ-binding-like beta-propeller repeat protein [Blastocatellia bacterium]